MTTSFLSRVLTVALAFATVPAMAQSLTANPDGPTGPPDTEVSLPGIPHSFGGVTFYTDRASYQAEVLGAMIFEDWEDTTVGDGGVSGCTAPADNSSNDPPCWVPGDIIEGMNVTN